MDPGTDASGTEGSAESVDRIFEACFRESAAYWEAAVEAACARHPEHADEIRRRWRQLGEIVAAPRAPHAAPSDQFGKFRLLRQVGRGGMGVVYRARDATLGRDVALKVIRPEYLGSDRARQRFRREVEAASRLDDPGICTVYEAGEVDGLPYLSMRWIEGRSLEEIVRERAGEDAAGSSRERVLENVRLIEQVARALHVAHEHGLVHRDVKPGNVMVTPNGTPVVLDFGLVQRADDADSGLTMSGEVLGTPAYMAPEQVEPRGRIVDRRTDVYALGATLYELSTGRLPFEGHSLESLARRILAGGAPPPSAFDASVPRDLDVVVSVAMDTDPARRYRTALDLAEDLQRVCTRQPIRARPAGPLRRVRRWVERSPLAAAIVVLLAISAAVTGWLWREAEAAIVETRRLSDIHHVARARQEAEAECWPVHPERIPELEAWLARSDEFRGMLAYHEEHLRAAGPPEKLDPGALWVHEHRAQLVAELRGFLEDPTVPGSVPDVQRRLVAARSLRARSIGDHAAAFAELRAALARDARLAAVSPEPEDWIGFVPLGADPESGLLEFAHVLSGEVPERDATGRLGVSEASAIVLVLVPGGSYWQGASWVDGAADPDADADEARRHVTVEPFLIGKFEIGQGQWQRCAGGNPSAYPAPAGPVDSVSWQDATTWLPRFGLRLPTEAEWELAARGGTPWRWWTGPERTALDHAGVNFADRDFGTTLPTYEHDADLGDGWSGVAPFDSGTPNPYGLHHVLGNLFEWCEDVYRSRPTQGDYHSYRGGSYYQTAKELRVSRRWYHEPGHASFLIGVRAAATAPLRGR